MSSGGEFLLGREGGRKDIYHIPKENLLLWNDSEQKSTGFS